MTEESNNQPATPPNDYQNHLIWRNIFIYIFLPFQFYGIICAIYQIINEFNEYGTIFAITSLFAGIILITSIIVIIISSIYKKPIGYKSIQFYSIFLIIYKTASLTREFILLNYMKNIDLALVQNVLSNYLAFDILYAAIYIAIAIINLIYFSHRKFLFGIYPEEPTTSPVSEQEPKGNNQ